MAEIMTPQELDPEFQAAPFVPPYPKHLQSPQEFMRFNGWKPLNGELGVGYDQRRRFHLTSKEEDQAFGEMMSRSERFEQERSAWVQAHAQNFAKTIEGQANAIEIPPPPPQTTT